MEAVVVKFYLHKKETEHLSEVGRNQGPEGFL